ncbi:ribonuclease HI [Basilea psittacipulmonis]|uniref:Ribonuclease H n=1 Tax=Basilea psittacipulmonis DSM 24701 TaxID=1072685 RepID=A0A077DIS2_9BURK|nr:ribonuclease HI [Basilea psittacipulmonis]AIL33058.1 ribonuclease H [Basilea psittacipulmonis DSM 24701]
MTTVEMWTDGACKGNPGPGGWGVLLKSGTHCKELCGGESNTTNNRMELQAVIEGLNALKRPCSVTIYTDSQYVKNGITSWLQNWKNNNWKTSTKKAVKNQDLWEALDQSCQRHKIQWVWVKGHADNEGNIIADRLANEGTPSLETAPS